MAGPPRSTALPGRLRAARHRWQRLLLLIGVLLAGGCSDLLPPSYEYSSVEVQATRRNGEPVAGVDLTLYRYGQHVAYGTTDASGRFVFDRVAFGEYGVAAGPPEGYAFQAPSTNYAAVDGIRIRAAERQQASFILYKYGNGTIQVRTVDASGQPVPNVEIHLYTFRGDVASAVTDSLGRHTFDPVAFGQYGVRASPPVGYSLRKGIVDGVDIEQGSVETALLTLTPCRGSIRVRISDLEREPVPGVEVMLYTFRGALARGITDEQGTFVFADLPCRVQYGVTMQPLPSGFAVPAGSRDYADGIDLFEPEQRAVEFRVRTCYGAVTTRVVDQDGAAVANASVTLYTYRRSVAEGKTDEQGRVIFSRVPCDQYGVQVVPPAGYSAQPGRGTSYLDGLVVEENGEAAARLVVNRQ